MAEHSIITGEGVELELPAATVLSRIVSSLIDYGLLTIAYTALIFSLASTFPDLNGAQVGTLIVSATAIFFWLVPALVTASSNGRSLGKLVTRTRVVRLDGGTITANQAFIRATAGILEVIGTLGLIATVASFVTKNSQRLGDMLAGTYVVRWPSRSAWEPRASMPRELAGWAQIAQTRALPIGLSLNVADFLKGRDRLTAQARQAQARALAAACEKYVAPPPPWGTPAEAFIEALTVIRYDVERRRFAQAAERRQRLGTREAEIPYGLDEAAWAQR
ncbi:RDD family protein [Trueperella sp.]|uniref:RDD family protein n=1 Tax=Trueperella sp. TaxID=2699835 RepID=UPI00262BC116|nr:RDD family protein [Trueperella sp.]